MAPPLSRSGSGFRRGLDEHIDLARANRFELGRMDCSIWVADWVRKRTGVDLAADFRGRYSTRAEYLRLIIPLGNLVRIASRRLASIGAELIPEGEAQPGDIGVVPSTDGPVLAIRGDGEWLCKTDDRLLTAPHATIAWRLP